MQAGLFVLFLAGVLAGAGARAQAQQTDPMPPETQAPPPTMVAPEAGQPQPPATASPGAEQPAAPGATATAASARRTWTVPAGTKVLLQLKSAVNTKTAKPGDGVYLVSIFPVVGEGRVLIPAGVYVQGMVDRVERAGRVTGKAKLDMHFTSIIFPNGTVAEIPGMVSALPGSKETAVKDGEGTIEQESSHKMRHAGKVAEVGVPTGGTIGSIAGAVNGDPLTGGLAGMAGGLAAAGLVSLFTRGADVNIEAGTQVEMVLQRSLVLEEQNLSGYGQSGLGPAPNQPKPMEKPGRRILCPVGGLGCE